MSLEKAHTSVKKMTFGENRDLERVVTAPVSSGKIKRVNVNFDEEKHTGLRLHAPGKVHQLLTW